MKLFLDLAPGDEEMLFRKWARDNYKPGTPINGCWHPVTQDECVKINALATLNPVTLELE